MMRKMRGLDIDEDNEEAANISEQNDKIIKIYIHKITIKIFHTRVIPK